MNKLPLAMGLALSATLGTSAMAQETIESDSERVLRTEVVENTDKYKVETNHFFDNWFVMAGAGAKMYFSDHNKQMNFGDRLTPSFNLGLGKWFTPGIGVRTVVNGLKLNGLTQIRDHGNGKVYDWTDKKDYTPSAPPLYEMEVKYVQIHGDVMFNLNNLLLGYQEDRFWSIAPYVGLGYAMTDQDYYAKEMTANVGLINTFRICEAVDVNLDVHATLINDRFDGEHGGRRKDGILAANVNLVYKFPRRGWDRSRVTTIYDDTESSRLRQLLDDANSKNEQLNHELANRKSERVVEKVNIATPLYVTFKINRAELSEADRVRLGMFADAIKHGDSNAVYVISGFADAATGNQKINDRLSQQRAQAVFDCLTKEFGIAAKQLEMEPKGGVGNMFYNQPKLSRAVIMKVK